MKNDVARLSLFLDVEDNVFTLVISPKDKRVVATDNARYKRVEKSFLGQVKPSLIPNLERANFRVIDKR